MEVDEIQTPQPARKFCRVNSNGGRIDSSKIAAEPPSTTTAALESKSQPNNTNPATTSATTTTTEAVAASTCLRRWPPSSRIIRVSRASGGKDRHSKVWTARGPRDRRVRLSVNTAIQFYDLQDRLGYDQPSKAVEWLIKAAADAINELPPLDSCSTFPPETPRQLSDERRADSADPDPDGEPEPEPGLGQNLQQQQQLSKSGCSSNNSENSKGSGLSLSRSEIRVKARERARERAAKEKERESEPTRVNFSGQPQNQQNAITMPQTSSFTQLLTAGISNLNESNMSSSPVASSLSPDVDLFQKQARGSNQWLPASTTAMDYFGSTGLMGPSSSRQIQVGNTSHSLPQVMTISSFSVEGSASESRQQQQQHSSHGLHHHPQHFPFVPADQQHLIPVANTAAGVGAGGNVYNFNFTFSSSSTSSGLGAGFNRGTLQSNSPSLLPYLQRLSTTDRSSVPFLLGGAAVSSAAPAEESQHHHQQFQPPGLQLCYGGRGRQSDQKGKAKN